MDIEKKKIEILTVLKEIESDCEKLMRGVKRAKEDLEYVQTVDQLKIYAMVHELDYGLTHIELF